MFLYVTWFDSPKEFWLEFRRIEETAELNTPDGKYFIAHSKIPRGWRVRYKDVKDQLLEVGLTWKKIKASHQLNREQLAAVCHILHAKPVRWTPLSRHQKYHS